MSGTVTVMPGYTWTSSSDVLNYAKLNQTGNPSMQVGAGGISSREINFSLMPIPPASNAVLFEDFLQVAPAGGINFTGLIGTNRLVRRCTSNNATVESAPSTAGYAGVVIFTDPVDSHGTGYCVIRGTLGQWVLGHGEITVEWKIISPNALSGVDIYTLYIGLANGAADCGAPSNGVYFSYTDTVSSGKWVGMTTASSVSTSVVGPTMVVSTAYVLKAVIAADATSVEFFVNGTSIGTSSANIPTSALTYICGMNDTDSSASANAFYADWVRIEQNFSTSR